RSITGDEVARPRDGLDASPRHVGSPRWSVRSEVMQLLGNPSRARDGIAHRKARPGVELPPNPSGPCPPVRIGGQGRGIIPPRALAPRIAVSNDQTLRFFFKQKTAYEIS